MRFFAPVLLLSAVLFYILNKNYPHVLDTHQNYLYILQGVVIVPFVVLSIARSGLTLTMVLKSIGIWLSIALVLVSGYSYRYAIKDYYYNIIGHLVPSMAVQQTDGSITFQAGNDGHFKVQASINGQSVEFLVDTGATRVALTPGDAERIGFNLNALKYDVRISTANGVALYSSVTIPQIIVGDIVVTDVSAYVAKSGLDTSLLGMSFLAKLKEYEVTQDTLTLRK